jgi:hypothetical protein
MNDAKAEAFYAHMKLEGLLIDPETAEVCWQFRSDADPYEIGAYPDADVYVGRQYFAKRPGSEIWVCFRHIPDEVREKLWKHPNAKPSFTIQLNRGW